MSESEHSQKLDLERVVLRPATEDDLPVLRDLFESGLVEGQLRENDIGADIENLAEAYLAEGGGSGFWVAVYEQQIVGMIGVQRHEEHVAEIRRLRVSPRCRRQGVGTRLVEQAVAFCRDQAYLKVMLDVRVERGPAIRMFEKFGFQLSRSREVAGRKLFDFYFDMYRDPGIASG